MSHTIEQLQKMTDDELDVVVAEVVMRWKMGMVGTTDFSCSRGWILEGVLKCLADDWSPSTSWEDMGAVWRLMNEKGFDVLVSYCMVELVEHERDTCVRVPVDYLNGEVTNLLPRAIAIASVLAVQEMKQ